MKKYLLAREERTELLPTIFKLDTRSAGPGSCLLDALGCFVQDKTCLVLFL